MSDLALSSNPGRPAASAVGESPLLRLAIIAVAVAFLGLFLLLPLIVVFAEAFAHGFGGYFKTFLDPDVLAAIRQTLIVAAIVVPLNTAFGLCAAWWITKFDFRGKDLVITLIDLPFSVSPVVSGLIFVLVFGAQGVLGPWATASGLHIIFAVPGIVLATLFVTFPFVAREVIPLMQSQGRAEEEAALTLGATGLKAFFTVTLPNIRWALSYGVLLCNARAMGEFGAVSVVSGHIRGMTNTIPLQVEILYNEYSIASAFALATLLALLALVTLGAKTPLEWRTRQTDSGGFPNVAPE
jgi:sulfate/thiosulfate transport system permease protein